MDMTASLKGLQTGQSGENLSITKQMTKLNVKY